MSNSVERHYGNWHLFGLVDQLTIVFLKRDDGPTSISIPWGDFEKFITEVVEKFDA